MLRKNVPPYSRVYGLSVRPSAHRKGNAGLRTRRRGRVPISLKAERRKSGEGAAFSPNIPASAFTAFPLFKNHAPNEDFLLYKEKKTCLCCDFFLSFRIHATRTRGGICSNFLHQRGYHQSTTALRSFWRVTMLSTLLRFLYMNDSESAQPGHAPAFADQPSQR